jgi:hypothetical protein
MINEFVITIYVINETIAMIILSRLFLWGRIFVIYPPLVTQQVDIISHSLTLLF